MTTYHSPPGLRSDPCESRYAGFTTLSYASYQDEIITESSLNLLRTSMLRRDQPGLPDC